MHFRQEHHEMTCVLSASRQEGQPLARLIAGGDSGGYRWYLQGFSIAE